MFNTIIISIIYRHIHILGIPRYLDLISTTPLDAWSHVETITLHNVSLEGKYASSEAARIRALEKKLKQREEAMKGMGREGPVQNFPSGVKIYIQANLRWPEEDQAIAYLPSLAVL